MDDRRTTGPTGSLPRDVAERVLRRAADMSPEPARAAWTETVSEQVLIEAAAEVGIEPSAVQRALAVERLGSSPTAKRSDRLLGPAHVAADIETPWSPDDTLRLIDTWLVQAHHLRRERSRADGGEWRRRHDMVAKFQRTLRGFNGEAKLGDVEAVEATATSVDGTVTFARVTVHRSAQRAAYAAAGAAVATVGAASIVAAGVLTAPVLVAATPLAVIGGAAVARLGRMESTKTEREVARLLDAVQRGERPHSVSADVLAMFRTRRR